MPDPGTDEIGLALCAPQDFRNEWKLQSMHGVREGLSHGYSHSRLRDGRTEGAFHGMYPVQHMRERMPDKHPGSLFRIGPRRT
jgi:hypothetical protein